MYLEKNPDIKNERNLSFLNDARIINPNDKTKVENFFFGNVHRILVSYDPIYGGNNNYLNQFYNKIIY